MPDDAQKIISGNFYGLEIDPETSNIYAFSSNGFQGNGSFSIYDSLGNLLRSEIETGIGPNGAVFVGE